MAAKDGSFEFDFYSTNGTEVREVFDPENQNPPEMQQQGWQAILNQFKRYVEQ